MAREPTLFVSSPYPQIFYRALLAALVGHALVLAAMGLYASGSVFQAEPPVVATPVSLVLTAPAARAVSSQAPAAQRLTPRPSAAPPPKPSKPVESPAPVKSPEKLEPVQAVETNQTREAPESAALPTQPLGPARQDSPTSPAPVTPVTAVTPAAAASSGQSNGLPQARIRASAQCVAPSYPRRSIMNNEQGVSQIELLIGEDGRVRESRVAQSSGFFRLDQAALQALSACEFEPERINGEARQAWARIRYVWRLD
jgi:periplasmic protein TonB